MQWFVSATSKRGITYKIPATNNKHESDANQSAECKRMIAHFEGFGYTNVVAEAY